jgi:hypothetical protein
VISQLEDRIAEFHQPWIPTRKVKNVWIRAGSRRGDRKALVSNELFGKLFSDLTGWNLAAKSAHHWAKVYRNEKPPWEASFSSIKQRALLRCLARLYAFLAPEPKSIVLCEQLCGLDNIDFIPGSLVYKISSRVNADPVEPLVQVLIRDLLIASPYPLATMEYCRIGALCEPMLQWFGNRTTLLANFRKALQNHFGCKLHLLGASENSLVREHFKAFLLKGRKPTFKFKATEPLSEQDCNVLMSISVRETSRSLNQIIESDRERDILDIYMETLASVVVEPILAQREVLAEKSIVGFKDYLQRPIHDIFVRDDGNGFLELRPTYKSYVHTIEGVASFMNSAPFMSKGELVHSPLTIAENLNLIGPGFPNDEPTNLNNLQHLLKTR